MFRIILFCASIMGLPAALAASFEDAQEAATEGRYDDVVNILSTIIAAGNLDDKGEVIAYSNRGVAYSLLKAYEMAKQDLLYAIELDPDHLLTINHLGIMDEHVDGDYEQAALWYQMAADAGYAASQANLATLYKEGLGVARDYVAAFNLFTGAAKQQYILAFVPLGEMYMQGLGTRRDYETGLTWINQGVAAGVISANYYLGKAYEKGTGVTRDYKRAADAYYIAAMQGHGAAQNALGYLFRQGAGVRQDFEKAVEWYQLSADQGHIPATNRLAWLLATCPTRRVCNGAAALELASQAVRSERSATNLDSLAAAHARLGNYDAAIHAINEIVRMQGKRSHYAGRLRLYKQRKPFQI